MLDRSGRWNAALVERATGLQGRTAAKAYYKHGQTASFVLHKVIMTKVKSKRNSNKNLRFIQILLETVHQYFDVILTTQKNRFYSEYQNLYLNFALIDYT